MDVELYVYDLSGVSPPPLGRIATDSYRAWLDNSLWDLLGSK
jgi:hypothetical protein